MLIPFFFILLRIWSCIIDILMYAEIDIHKLSWVVALVLILLSVSHQFLHPLTTHCLFIHHDSIDQTSVYSPISYYHYSSINLPHEYPSIHSCSFIHAGFVIRVLVTLVKVWLMDFSLLC